MSINTLRTIFGFFATLIRNITGISIRKNKPEAVYNYRRISDWLRTSGQPTEKQLAAIHASGFHRVINLAPSAAENALPNEAASLSELGAEYIHIPVDFKNPTEANFEQFAALLQDNGEAPIWVHCAANMRVSAFIYRYRRDVLKEDEVAARKDLHALWTPFGVWKEFIKR